MPMPPTGDEVRDLASDVAASPTRARLHLAVAVFVALVLPGGSLIAGGGVFAWTMFSKSETYRLTIEGRTADGQVASLDPRALGPHVNRSLAFFLPEKDRFRHDPVGLTFRTGLGHMATLACRLGPLVSTQVTLEERANLDARPRVTVAHARCP
jgi:hypothetical protein